jgi:hypothetical protein
MSGKCGAYEKYTILTKIIIIIIVVVIVKCSSILLCMFLGTTFGLTPGCHGGVALCPLIHSLYYLQNIYLIKQLIFIITFVFPLC